MHSIIHHRLLTIVMICIVVSLFMTTGSRAQSGTRYGLKIGMTISDVSEEIEQVYGKTVKRYGLSLGGYAMIPLLGPVYLQPELIFSQKGANSDQGVDDGLKLSYIDIPVLIGISVSDRYSIRPGAYVGPAISLLTSSEAEFGEITVDIGENITKFDFSVVLGGRTDIRYGDGAFTFEGRYVIGFESIDDRRGEPTDIRNRSVSFLIGYLF